jgi:hypothetical protein
MPCEDAPCCGCCGTSLYGSEEGPSEPEYCSICGGFGHSDYDCQED